MNEKKGEKYDLYYFAIKELFLYQLTRCSSDTDGDRAIEWDINGPSNSSAVAISSPRNGKGAKPTGICDSPDVATARDFAGSPRSAQST